MSQEETQEEIQEEVEEEEEESEWGLPRIAATLVIILLIAAIIYLIFGAFWSGAATLTLVTSLLKGGA